MAEVKGGTISVHCKCGKKLKAPATAVGRKAKCPNCGNVLTVEAPPPADEMDDALYDLAGQAQSAAQEAPVASANCPSCFTPLAAGAVLCTNCGYDTRTGKKLGTEADAAPAGKPQAAAKGTRYIPGLQTKVEPEKAAPSGSLVKGTIFSAVLASIGALVWFGIAKGTGYEIGWIAWGVGLAAGIGMMAGYNGTSVHSGMIAAAIAVGGILLGKFLIVLWVVMPMLDNKFDEIFKDLPNEAKVQVFVVFEILRAKGIEPDDATDDETAAARTEARARIAKMDDAAKQAKIREGMDSIKSYGKNKVMSEHKGEIFKEMFSPADIVFMVIAIASAFKMATFGGEVES